MDPKLEWNQSKNIVDDFFTAELLLDKQRAGPSFVFRETVTMFILTAHLKGYKRDNIKVQINKGGKRVAVIGEKQVQETMMVENKAYSKEMVMKGFTKVFQFSDGVKLDEATATFSKQEFLLTISIPKLERGFRGTRVEEVKQEVIGGSYELLVINENKVDEIHSSLEDGKHREGDLEKGRNKDAVQEDKEELEKREIVQEFDQTPTRQVETFKDQEIEEKQESVNPDESKPVEKPDNIEDRKFESEQEKLRTEEEQEGEIAKSDECPKIKKNKCKLCNPVILGSTILVTISVLVICFIKSQNSHKKRKN